MKRVQITVWILTMMSAVSAESRQSTTLSEPLQVAIYRRTRVEPKVLKSAIQQAESILAHAGVRVVWWDCSTSGPVTKNCAASGPATLLIHFYDSTTQKAPVKAHSKALAFSLPQPAPDHGYFGGVFWDRVRTFANDCQKDADLLLGSVLAHEIGHLLLGQRGHARQGIMAVPWSGETMVQLSQGYLLFTSDQIKKIRVNLDLRLQEQREQFSQNAPPESGGIAGP